MANKISVLIDVATDKAVSGLKGFKASINDADGAVNKMKAGATAAFDQIKAHAATAALAAGAALVTFGAKGVAAFTSLALEAGKFRDVSGATLDEASRWIAVGDDIGVSGDAISAAWNKMNIAIGSGKPLLKEYGIELKKTVDGQADANGTFLNAIDTINGIQDPTKRAELAAATFGKGWASMSELIEQGSDTIVTAMGEVSDAQIIDEGEIAKAKKFRESMDKLGDSVKDLAMEVGEELTPAVSVFADMLAGVAPIAGKMGGFVSDQFVKIADEAYEAGQTIAEWADALPFVEVAGLADGIEHTVYEFDQLERSVAENIDAWQQGVSTMDEFVAKLEAMGLSQDEINIAMGLSKFSLSENKKATEEAAAAAEELTEATDELVVSSEKSTLAHWDVTESLAAKKRADEEAEQAARDHIDALNEQIEATTALVGGDIAVRDAQLAATVAVADATLTQDEQAAALINAAEAAATYDEKVGNAAGKTLDAAGKQDLLRSKLEELALTLAPGSPLLAQIQAYIDLLNNIPASRETRVFVTSSASGAGQGPIRVPEFATGGTVPGPVGAAQLAVVHGGEQITPVGGNGNGHAPIAITVNAGMGADGHRIGDAVVDAIRDFERRNGTGWRR